MRLALALVALVAASPAGAKQNKQTSIMGLTGTCTKLIVNGKDRTADCAGKLLNTAYADSRTGFYFVAGEDLVLTFSGVGARQVKLDEDHVVMPIDLVILGFKGQNDKITAVGTCSFANPYSGPVPITCKAEGALGTFEGSFMTDGSKPTRHDL